MLEGFCIVVHRVVLLLCFGKTLVLLVLQFIPSHVGLTSGSVFVSVTERCLVIWVQHCKLFALRCLVSGGWIVVGYLTLLID